MSGEAKYFYGGNQSPCIGTAYCKDATRLFGPAIGSLDGAEQLEALPIEFSIDDGSSLDGGRKVSADEWLVFQREKGRG